MARVYTADNCLIHEITFENETELVIDDPVLWNSEQPYLYTLVLETEHEGDLNISESERSTSRTASSISMGHL